MENIQFNPQDNTEKELKNVGYNPQPKQPMMVGWIIKISGGKIDDVKANYVLLGIAVIFTVLTIIMVINMLGVGGTNKVTYKEDISEEVRAVMPPEIYNSLPSRSN